MSIDFKMQETPVYDIAIENGDLVLVDGIDSLRQEIIIGLYILLGEWFLDTTLGVISIEDLKNNPIDFEALADRAQTEILSHEGVIEILSFENNLDLATDAFIINTEILVEDGVITINNVTLKPKEFQVDFEEAQNF